MRTRAFFVAAGLLAVAFVVGSASAVTCPTVTAPFVDFNDPVYIDPQRAGGEPVSVVAQDGSIIVSAHAGTTHLYKTPDAAPGSGDFAVGYWNQTLNWRSTDGGKTWTHIGLAGAPVGPHTPMSTGFSDPDLTIDAGGRIYNTEIDLANVSVYSSVDDAQSFPFGNPAVATGDRPWLLGQERDEVFLLVNAFVGQWLMRSTDGGLTWRIVTRSAPVRGKMVNDPLNPDHGLIGPAGQGPRRDIAISSDDGATWRTITGANLGPATQFFGTVAADKAGWIYTATAGGYTGPNDVNPNANVRMAYFNRQTETWNQAVVPTPPGDALWPWLIAGDDGRLAIAWYQSHPGAPQDFYVYVAVSHNAHGTTVTCSDGSARFIPPQFSVVRASDRVVHHGKICLQGTNCNIGFDVEGSDRRLGDFLTINFDLEGNLFVAASDTMLLNPVGGPKIVSNPIFIRQSAGERMLVTPIQARQTRCLFPLPAC